MNKPLEISLGELKSKYKARRCAWSGMRRNGRPFHAACEWQSWTNGGAAAPMDRRASR